MWNGDEWLERMYEETINRPARQREELPNERRQRLRESLRHAVSSFPPNDQHKPKLLERVECDGYIRERVELSATPGLTFAAYVLIPQHTQGTLPAAVAMHGHGYGSREIVGLKRDGSPDENAPGIHRHYALELVKRGLIVIAPDVLGFGERMLKSDLERDPSLPNSCHRLAAALLLMGKTLTGLRVAEALCAYQYLRSRADVDTDRIGMMGFSGGALISFAASVLEARIKAVVLSGYANTMKDSIIAVRHCIDNYTPGLLLHAELPELIGLIAPKALFLESGGQDPIFPVAGFRKAVDVISGIYESEGAGDKLAVDVFPGGHEVSGRMSYDWLKKELLGD